MVDEFRAKVVGEVLDDLVSAVRTPPPPPPDLSDPEQARVEFEELNHGERMFYSEEVVRLLRWSHEEMTEVMGGGEWNLDVGVLRAMLE